MNNINNLGKYISEYIKNGYELENLENIINSYEGSDWREYCNFCKKKYKRNLVYTDDNIDVYIICWDRYQESKIHNHPDNGCLVRVMEGELIEYDYNENNKFIKKNIINKNSISFKKGNYDRHNIINGEDKSITLHIYSPPNFVTKYF